MEFYHNIHQMDEAPPDHIIEDDEELDAFLRARKSKREVADRKSRLNAAKPKAGGKHTREKIL